MTARCRGCGRPFNPGRCPVIHPLAIVDVRGWCPTCAPAVLVEIGRTFAFEEACRKAETPGRVSP